MAYSGDSSRITALNQVYRYRRRSPLGGHTRAGELANAWLEAQYELGCTIQERVVLHVKDPSDLVTCVPY